MISSPENIVGIENFKAYYQNFTTGFSDIKFTVVDIFGQGNNIVKHWNFKGKHTGDFFGIPATGKSVDIEGVTTSQNERWQNCTRTRFYGQYGFYATIRHGVFTGKHWNC